MKSFANYLEFWLTPSYKQTLFLNRIKCQATWKQCELRANTPCTGTIFWQALQHQSGLWVYDLEQACGPPRAYKKSQKFSWLGTLPLIWMTWDRSMCLSLLCESSLPTMWVSSLYVQLLPLFVCQCLLSCTTPFAGTPKKKKTHSKALLSSYSVYEPVAGLLCFCCSSFFYLHRLFYF